MYRQSGVKQSMEKCKLEARYCEKELWEKELMIMNDIAAIRDNLYGKMTEQELGRKCQETKEAMKDAKELVNQLLSLANQMPHTFVRSELIATAEMHREVLERDVQELRSATLTAMRRIEVDTREALLKGSDSLLLRKRNTGADSMQQQSSQVTDGLSMLVSRMNEQVEQSGLTLGSLVGSSHVLKETETEFSSMGGTIQSSSKLLSKYDRREMTDKILITLGLCFFFLVVLYIVKKRLFPSGWF